MRIAASSRSDGHGCGCCCDAFSWSQKKAIGSTDGPVRNWLNWHSIPFAAGLVQLTE